MKIVKKPMIEPKIKTNMIDTNGWAEYKLTVIKQLDYLAEEMRLIRETTARIDKELVSAQVRDTIETSANKAAIALQATEYERRLNELNHVHAKAAEDRTLFCKSETFENCKKNHEDWKIRIQEQMSTQKGEDLASRRIWFGIVIGINVVINIIGVSVAIAFKL